MAFKFQVTTLDDQQSVQELKKLIKTSEADADINVDLQSKIVTIDSKASEETFKELLVAAGHSVSVPSES